MIHLYCLFFFVTFFFFLRIQFLVMLPLYVNSYNIVFDYIGYDRVDNDDTNI